MGSMQSPNSLQLDFLEQCTIGDEQKVRNMLNAHVVDVTYQHPINGWTALHWAARRGYEEICVLLLDSGFSREVRNKQGQTPFEVCSENNTALREILRPESIECDDQSDVIMPSVCDQRRHSEDADSQNKFVPNYIRHPPFPYVSKASSFDYGMKAPYYFQKIDRLMFEVSQEKRLLHADDQILQCYLLLKVLEICSSFAFCTSRTPSRSTESKRRGRGIFEFTNNASPTTQNGYYSYGRRDSAQKTRFLLVRTYCTDSKQAFKRVTLPGGSTMEQMKKMVEKSMRKGRVQAILTLPDRVLVEEDSQIAEFSDCQKVEVIYGDHEMTPPPVGDKPINTARTTTANGSMEGEEKKTQEHEETGSDTGAAGGGDNFPITLVESFASNPPDSTNAGQDDNLSNEGSIPIEKIPSMDVTPVETEENNDMHSEVESAQKISLRKSIDSDPGDFVKIETPENGSSGVEVKSATPPLDILEKAKEVEKKAEEPPKPKEEETVLTPVTVKLEKKKSDDKPSYGLMAWIHDNPHMVRCCAATAAVVGVAGIASFVYARRIRSGAV